MADDISPLSFFREKALTSAFTSRLPLSHTHYLRQYNTSLPAIDEPSVFGADVNTSVRQQDDSDARQSQLQYQEYATILASPPCTSTSGDLKWFCCQW